MAQSSTFSANAGWDTSTPNPKARTANPRMMPCSRIASKLGYFNRLCGSFTSRVRPPATRQTGGGDDFRQGGAQPICSCLLHRASPVAKPSVRCVHRSCKTRGSGGSCGPCAAPAFLVRARSWELAARTPLTARGPGDRCGGSPTTGSVPTLPGHHVAELEGEIYLKAVLAGAQMHAKD